MEIRTPLSGFRAAEQSMAKRADRIARATLEGVSSSDARAVAESSPSEAPPAPQTAERKPDIVSDVVGMTTDRLAGAYDIKAMKVRDRMMGELLDLVR